MRFNNNSKPKEDKRNFKNIKNRCYFKLVELINDNALYIGAADEKQERVITVALEWIRLSKELDDQIASIMSKDEFKKRLGRSSDYSDTLMLRAFHEIENNSGFSKGLYMHI